MTITENVWKPIYQAIFHDIQSVTIEGITYPVQVYHNGCRMVDYADVRFIEQNKKKLNSKTADRAKEGAKIMWMCTKDFEIYYGRIENGKLYT